MNDRIIILDDSVILKHNYTGNNEWEQVIGFPRGGLTYLISNTTIKFFATHDYFYRNCIMSLQLPVWIVDETMQIDGEYGDIEELTEILDRIFPTANGEVDLSPYLKIIDAMETYQPIGEYLTKESGDTYYQPKGEYVTDEELALALDDYLTISGAAETYQPIGDYQPAGDYLSGNALSGYATEEWVEEKGYITGVDLSDYVTFDDGDLRYQPIGDYQPAGDYLSANSLNGYATETWVKNQGYIDEIKTINGISLIGTGNINIGSGGTSVDSYSKAESDERYQPKGEYVTSATFMTYITNLQQQIETIINSVSGCCSSTGETIYRWLTMTGDNDYICSGTTKWSKEVKQQSTDNGMTWTNVTPVEYRAGEIIETDSSDCGYQPVIEYRWVNVTGGYVCDGTTKYNQEKQQYRIDGGAWTDVTPINTRKGSTVIERDSVDCGYIAPVYRWYQAPASDYLCSGTSKYYKEYYQVSTDGGSTWTNVTPTQTRTGALIENNSVDCGYVEPIYRWVDTTSTTCNGYDKCYVKRQQVSYNNGTSWQNTSVTGYGTTIEANSYDCGYVGNPKIKTTTDQGATYQVNCNSNSTLTQAEVNRCFDATENQGCTVKVEIGNCVTKIGTGSTVTRIHTSCMTACTLPNTLIYIGPYTFENCKALTGITLPSAITTIESNAFRNCSGMTSIDIPANVTYIGTAAFSGCSSLQSITVRATTPPTLGGIGVFENGNSPIYVPAASLNTYKQASGWSNYATRIQAIS